MHLSSVSETHEADNYTRAYLVKSVCHAVKSMIRESVMEGFPGGSDTQLRPGGWGGTSKKRPDIG